jgi:thiol:disulfide interchange protein
MTGTMITGAGIRNRRRRVIFFKALVYALGMATMYSFLGMLAGPTGSMFGGLMQNLWMLAVIGLVLYRSFKNLKSHEEQALKKGTMP